MIINSYRYGKKLSVAPNHWWDLDDDGTWADSVGSWHGTESGAVGVSSGTGPGGQDVASFDTDGDYLDCGLHNPVSEGITDYTICAWLSFSSFNGGNYGNFPFSWRNSTATSHMFDLYYAGQTSDVLATKGPGSGGTGYLEASPVTEAVDTWYHMLATYNDSTGARELFVDGVSVDIATAVGTVPNASIRLTFGKASDFSATTTQFKGKAGMFGIFNQVLSQDDIDFLYNSGSGRQYAEL